MTQPEEDQPTSASADEDEEPKADEAPATDVETSVETKVEPRADQGGGR